MLFNLKRERANAYRVTVPPVTTPVTLTRVKDYLRITNNDQDALINLLIQTATKFGEKYTRIDFINRTNETFRDDFSCPFIELKRGPLDSVSMIQYINDTDGMLNTVDPTVYYNSIETYYSFIGLNNGQSWPSDVACRLQAVIITFITGFGADETDIPEDIKTALLAHIANLYENRGDCADCGCSNSSVVRSTLPAQSAAIYEQYRVPSMVVGVT